MTWLEVGPGALDRNEFGFERRRPLDVLDRSSQGCRTNPTKAELVGTNRFDNRWLGVDLPTVTNEARKRRYSRECSDRTRSEVGCKTQMTVAHEEDKVTRRARNWRAFIVHLNGLSVLPEVGRSALCDTARPQRSAATTSRDKQWKQ